MSTEMSNLTDKEAISGAAPQGQEVPTLLPAPYAPKFYINQPPRPILARDAESVYWMSRYVERAEHVARMLLIDSDLLMNVGDLAPKLQKRQRDSVLEIMDGSLPPPAQRSLKRGIGWYMTFDLDNPNSLRSCLTRARENARGMRESISAEMWETLNTLYWSLNGEEAESRFEEGPDFTFRQVMNGSMLFQGITDQTLSRDQRWLFVQLGKYLERITVTSRVIETKYEILAAAMLETPLRNINWMAVLRTCGSIEAYRRRQVGDMDPLRVVCFLLLERSLPRSIAFSVAQAHAAARELRGGGLRRPVDPAERILGRLNARLEYAEVAEVVEIGVTKYLQEIRHTTAEAALAVHEAYFPY